MSDTRPATISAALIVRDEATFIEGCLQSLVGNVDEIVLVDTGSRDDTVAIARRYPVKLHHFAWCNDFSAARNHALAQATGDWILYIDADERLSIPDRGALDRQLADPRNVGLQVRFHPRVDWTAYEELRLFRNHPRIRFHGVIHERIQPGIEEMVRNEGREVGSSSVELSHLGYEPDQRPKNPRNIPLLRDYLTREPERLYCWWHLGECLRMEGDDAAAIEAWSQGIAVMRKIPPERRIRGDGITFISLLKLLHDRGDPLDDIAAEAIGMYPDNLVLQWVSAQLDVLRGNLDAARPVLEKLQAIDAETFFDPAISYDKALFRHHAAEALALCRFRSGDYRDAARLYRIAARTAPDAASLEVRAKLAEARAS